MRFTPFFDVTDFEVVDLLGKPALLGLPDSMRLSLISFDKSRVFSSHGAKNIGEAYSTECQSTSTVVDKKALNRDTQGYV